MLRTTRNSTCAFLADLLFDLVARAARVHVLGFGGLCDDTLKGGSGDQFGFAIVPFGEDFRGWGAAQNAGVDEAGEADAGDVS
jgi:hypothetical protein